MSRFLAERCCLIRYHRQGYAGSSPLTGELTFVREAETFRALMKHLGIQHAHVVGGKTAKAEMLIGV